MLREVEKHPDSAFTFGDPQWGTVDLDTLLAKARRQLKVISVGAIGGLVLGLAYLIAEVPLYKSTTNILIDKDQPPVVTQLIDTGTPIQLDPMMLSQVELLHSDRIGLKVVDSLGLATDQSFLSTPYSLLDGLKGSVLKLVISLIGSSEKGASAELAEPRRTRSSKAGTRHSG